uniref:Uncharacterized protein n=1 Tax=Avena sativa TaxID=4498 RepID=A0ACD6APP7_AVESA
MAASMQVNTFPDVANMFTTGLLDDQFHQLQLLQDDGAPNFVAEVVTFFCEDGGQIIGELAKLLDKPCVDFVKVDAFVHQLKGSSARLEGDRFFVKRMVILGKIYHRLRSRSGKAIHFTY